MKVLEKTGEKSVYESAALPTELRRLAMTETTRQGQNITAQPIL